MAEYNYEGSLAAYFLLTILILILIPLSLSFRSQNSTSKRQIQTPASGHGS
jgi:hypothetical protein